MPSGPSAFPLKLSTRLGLIHTNDADKCTCFLSAAMLLIRHGSLKHYRVAKLRRPSPEIVLHKNIWVSPPSLASSHCSLQESTNNYSRKQDDSNAFIPIEETLFAHKDLPMMGKHSGVQ